MNARRSDRQLASWVYAGNSGIHGQGVFAARPISRQEYIGTFHGPKSKRDGTYVLWVEDAHGIYVARRGTNLLRFLNHSRPGNAVFHGFDLFAADTICIGDELTIDYGPDFFL
ncbi:MAG: SET domain-containing protein-lysine N-methyltransferase [Pseudomonadota bacterium]